MQYESKARRCCRDWTWIRTNKSIIPIIALPGRMLIACARFSLRAIADSSRSLISLRRDFLGLTGFALCGERIINHCRAAELAGDFLPSLPGCALLLELRSRKVLFVHGRQDAGKWLVPPGSVIKPLSLWALLSSGKVRPDESFPCPGTLRLAGLRMDCSHSRLPFPVDVSSAITYSCNCATAHFATRFAGDELGRFYEDFGLTSATHLLSGGESTGRVAHGVGGQQLQLQALGERGVRVTALEMMLAYSRLAGLVSDPQFAPILTGLEEAVEAGTGQAAQLPQKPVAGKTGSVEVTPGLHAAWFSGFAPSREPEVVVTVLTQGRSGAESAAPIAGEILRRYFSKGIS
jgi:cell division protein FtsI/penicillin-binding protein 2